MLLVAARVHDRGAAAVGAAVKIDFRIAEKLPHIVQIVHGDRRSVEANIGFRRVSGQTGAQPFERGFEIRFELLVIGLAVERVRIARAALIHQHDVAIGLERAERVADKARHFSGAASRTAGEVEDRVGSGLAAQARKDDHLQGKLAAGSRGAVLEDLHLTAVGVGRTLGTRAGFEPVDRRSRGTQPRAGQREQDQDRQKAKPPHGVESQDNRHGCGFGDKLECRWKQAAAECPPTLIRP